MKSKHSLSVMMLALMTAGVVGCATDPVLPPPLDVPARPGTSAPTSASATSAGTASAAEAAIARRNTNVETNPVPPAVAAKSIAPTPPVVATGGADVLLNFDQLALPAFIQTVYATVLKKNVSVDPAVMARRDLVTLRSGRAITAAEAENSVRTLLKSFGIAVQDVGGLIRIVPDTSNQGYLPEIRRGRALPESPLPLRPVFMLVELQSVRNIEVSGYLRTLFGEKVKYTEDPGRNALLLSGNGDDVQAALEAIQVLDQPLFKGRNSIRISPTIWSAEELSKRLTEILTQEGYAVGTTTSQGGLQYPITLLPIPGVNSVIVFANSKETINHIVDWAKVLDKPTENSVGRSFFSYQVRNTDASRLAETVQQLLGGAPSRVGTGAPASATGTTTGANAANTSATNTNTNRTTGVVVDKATNTILFRASGEEYTDMIRLLRDLDRTARQVLIEVTIAEVSLTDGMTTGISWLARRTNSSGPNITQFGGPNRAPTTGDPSATNFTGFLVNQIASSGNIIAELRAEATDNRITFLSTPKAMTRNGETARFQVGDSIPVLTSSLGSVSGGGGTNSNVLSTVQYVDTGTIMSIKPVIHSSDQVDLDVILESSQPGQVTANAPQSQPISKRTVETKLTLQHGSTYVLGGLIRDNNTVSTTGVPFLKDIPILGRAFKTDVRNKDRVELIIMITPYIMSDDSEARSVTEAVKKQLGGWASDVQLNNTTPLVTPKTDGK